MRIKDILKRLDKNMPNTTSEQDKVDWLVRLDGKIRDEVVATHETQTSLALGAGADLMPNPDGELLLPDRYTDLYYWYLISMVHLENDELQRYENYAALYNQAYSEFKNRYNLATMPIQAPSRRKKRVPPDHPLFK